MGVHSTHGRDAPRYLAGQVLADLDRKTVFVAGPRQVGKTTLARSLPGAAKGYLNWDIAEHRHRILRRELPPAGLWVFDEIHKYRHWRNYLKGLYDGLRRGQKILVTCTPSFACCRSAHPACGRSRSSASTTTSTGPWRPKTGRVSRTSPPATCSSGSITSRTRRDRISICATSATRMAGRWISWSSSGEPRRCSSNASGPTPPRTGDSNT